jgi:hypothetical protein
MYKFSILILLLFNVSCGEKRKHEQQKNVNYIDTLTVYDPATNSYRKLNKYMLNNKKKVIVYIDGTCFNCATDIILWDEKIKHSNNKNIDFLFYLYVDDFEKIKPYFRKWRFYHPIIIDTNNQFFKTNDLSGGNQALLVDKDNKILRKGNPLYNKTDSVYFSSYMSK